MDSDSSKPPPSSVGVAPSFPGAAERPIRAWHPAARSSRMPIRLQRSRGADAAFAPARLSPGSA
ncbi:hypothetical protein PHLH8_09990 [Pseudomonas sp. Pc102]|nr:hypothetical protein PHLH8_09990 [Pseudomonas sp. Pc102]